MIEEDALKDDMEESENDSRGEDLMETGEQAESTSNKEPGIVKKPRRTQIFLPGTPLQENEELVHDPSAYVMLHACQTGNPCLSFDVIPDNYGSNREAFPLTTYFVAGTQADKPFRNNIIIMKVSNLCKTLRKENSDSSDDSSDSEDEELGGNSTAVLDTALIKHMGTVNRIRCHQIGERVLAAAWSELGSVSIFDLRDGIARVNSPANHQAMKKKKMKDSTSPLFTFGGHRNEGYAVDWSNAAPGVLATGDCKRDIHIWTPTNATWHVDQRPLAGHTDSVEDLQWSPSEPSVLASCSVDKSLRIWDTRETGSNACKLQVENAHKADVNVISWNRKEPLLLSGGDDAIIHVWDLRQFKTGNAVATLKHHIKQVTSVEWSPNDSSVFASSGADDQVAVWDLSAERDPEDQSEQSEQLQDLPQQLLFIHQGQEDIKEIHWHNQIPGLITSTANSGFNFFIPISV